MTSELKTCPFCLRPLKRSSGKFNPMAVCETDGCWMKEKQIAVPCDDPFSVKSWNTRAVPDVPELVRWKHCEYPNQHKMMEHTEGEYVLHSQAAEIIAAKDAEIVNLKKECTEWAGSYGKKCSAFEDQKRHAEAAEADLERKDAALRFYADTSKYPAPLTGGMGALWGDCGQIARAALNVEASNDKV